MAGNIEQLVDELERSYHEAQERMSDPAVYNDHREAAAAGRRLKELEAPHRLAEEWRQLHDDLEAARGDGVLREMVPELEERSHAVEEELRVALAPTDPADSKDVIIEVRDAGLELRDELAEVAVRPRGVEIAARLLPLLCEPVGLLELLQLSPRGGRLPPVVVDRRVGHSLLRLAVRALELIDKLFDSGHE